MIKTSVAMSLCLLAGGCAMRNYTYYLIDVPVEKSSALKDNGTPLRPSAFGSTAVMKVRWNDGLVFTEVDVPILASGQHIVIEHSGKLASGQGSQSGQGTAQGTAQSPGKVGRGVVPPAPTKADQGLSEAYKERGLKENPQSADVSISRSKNLVQEALKSGNYALALEYTEMVLARYPSHPEFLRAKGSIMLLMGEREKAIEVYERAEEIESDPKVKQKLDELRKQK